MAFVAADLEAINRAIGSGAMEVRYADGSAVKYRTLDEMIRTRDLISASLNPPATSGIISRTTLMSFE